MDNPDWWVAAFTGLLIVLTGGQIWLNWRTDKHFRRTERAFVKLDHRTPGMIWTDKKGNGRILLITKNFGATPARTIHMSMTGRVVKSMDELPLLPVYEKPDPMEAFLVSQEQMTSSTPFEIDPNDYAAVMKGDLILIMYGFMDYEDRFGAIHRCGYARRYSPKRDKADSGKLDPQRNNLVYFREPGSYNFDFLVSERRWTEKT